MMNKYDDDYNPFWDGGAAALLLCTIAVSMYVFLCLPASESYTQMEKKLSVAQQRVEDKYDELKAYRIKADEIRRGDPLAIEEAIRQELLKGKSSEYVL